MKEIVYFDRVAQRLDKEQVYGQFFLNLLYGEGWWRRALSFFILPLFAYLPLFSYLYGFLQKRPASRRKIRPFIKKFAIDESEFLNPVDAFTSFNDFFIRKLKSQTRPFAEGADRMILPADARYLVFPKLKDVETFWVKGRAFSLETLLQDPVLARRYAEGSAVIARLCPVDYHRFHFPCEGTPGKAKEIKGPLFSVNPLALQGDGGILCENKRMVTAFETRKFGTLLLIEVGATYVGTICQTYTPSVHYEKGDEKGYFSFGGSCLLLVFEPHMIQFDRDLIEYSSKGIEVRGLLGQSLGVRIR